jgi:hypothetical protein
MANDTRNGRNEMTPVFLVGSLQDETDRFLDGTLWLTGGASLLLWTALALLLTSA